MGSTADGELDVVFDALANGHRRAIIRVLSLQPHSITQLAALQELSLPAIHKHIRALEDASLVIRRKVGRTNYLALNRGPLRDLQEWVGEFNPHWGNERETLENYAEYVGASHPERKDRS
jgi:DNA-binding transcriptional ArsR family regulator